MKNINKILLSLFVSTNIYALNLDEVVKISLDKNLDIKTSLYEYETSKESYNQSFSNFSPKVNLSYTYNSRDVVVAGDKKDSTASAIASLNLFNGFSDLAILNSTKYNKEAFQYYFNAKKLDVILNTKSAYLDLLNKKRDVATKEEAYKLFEKQYLDSKNKYEQGLMSKNDLLNIEVNMINAKQNLIQSKGNLDISKYELSSILGGFQINENALDDLNEQAISLNDFSEKMLENRSEYKASNLLVKSAKESSFGAKSAFMPKVDIFMSYNEYGDDATIGGGRTNLPDNQEVVNVTASWNIFNGTKDYSEVIKKNIAVKNALNNFEKLKLSLKLQFEKAKTNLGVATLNLDSSKVALEQAHENYKIVENRFKEGLSSTTELIDANYLLTLAKQNYNNAYYGKYLAVESIKRVLEIE